MPSFRLPSVRGLIGFFSRGCPSSIATCLACGRATWAPLQQPPYGLPGVWYLAENPSAQRYHQHRWQAKAQTEDCQLTRQPPTANRQPPTTANDSPPAAYQIRSSTLFYRTTSTSPFCSGAAFGTPSKFATSLFGRLYLLALLIVVRCSFFLFLFSSVLLYKPQIPWKQQTVPVTVHRQRARPAKWVSGIWFPKKRIVRQDDLMCDCLLSII